MQKQSEGESEGGTNRGVRLSGGQGNEGVSKTAPATTDSSSLSSSGRGGRQGWLQINWRTERGVSEGGSKKPISSHHLSSPSIQGNHWIIYTPLPSHCV